jgi:nascent polypeptide-associated complex subunit alpha
VLGRQGDHLGGVQIMFVIAKPDVLRSPNSDTYVVFGEAKIEDFGAQQQAQAAQSFLPTQSAPKPSPAVDAAPAGDEEDVDAEGMEDKDIELVMNQAGVSRAQAVTALKSTGGDIVSAIMELTVS